MSEALKIALTMLATVITLVVGEMVKRLFIDTIEEQRRIIGRIAHAMTLYRSTYVDPDWHSLSEDGKRQDNARRIEAAREIRRLVGELRQSIEVIPLYGLLEPLRFVRKRKTICEVSGWLLKWDVDIEKELIDLIYVNVKSLLRLKFPEARDIPDSKINAILGWEPKDANDE